MKTRLFTSLLAASALLLGLAVPVLRAQQPEIGVERLTEGGFAPPIPISISGFSTEVDSVLKNDLLFMGFKTVSADQAKFQVTAGENNSSSRVEGRVLERVTKRYVLNKAYTGGSLRTQTHAFADDIAQALTGRPGIAQTKIAFKAETGRSRGEIYIADYDGHNPVAVTQDGALVAAPCWAGRGALYYTSYKLGSPYIFYHQLNSGTRQAVARYSGLNSSPAVSPDGRRLAMILSKSGSPDLYVSDLNGASLRQLTATKEAESSPCWSPDNQTICYVSRQGGATGLFTVSASGGAARRLRTTGTPSPTEPDWSPDGKWIVFTSLMRDFQICLVPAEGGDSMVLAPGEDPTWAPNSRAVIFCKGTDHAKKLSLLDVPTKQVKDIARLLESNSQPSWAR